MKGDVKELWRIFGGIDTLFLEKTRNEILSS